jgi:DNA-binding response OmpR family regulator
MKHNEFVGILADKKVLYAEDEAGIRKNIADILDLFFMDVTAVDNGLAVLDEMALSHYDVLILDISMPKMDGLEAVQAIRKTNTKIPIIIVSAHSTQEYLWRAVELKISKYLTKPHTKEEIISALESAALELAEHQRKQIVLDQEHRYSPCMKSIFYQDERIHLSLTESRLLEYFIRKKNCTVNFEEIYDYLWGYEPHTKEALKSLIKDLRKKIGKGFIQNVYGIGYLFALDEK